MVPAVTRRARGPADDGACVYGPDGLVLILELTAAVEPIEGLARSGDRPAQAFSGWSELFAVLQTLISERNQGSIAPDRDQPP